MRSEKDIMNEINFMNNLEKEILEEMADIIKEGGNLYDLNDCMTRANELIYRKSTLEWVLEDEEDE